MSTITSVHSSPSDVSLEFEEFDYCDSDGRLTGNDVSDDHRMALFEVLWECYKATDFLETLPFLAIGCQGGPPDEDKRPFLVAGAIAIWTDAINFGTAPFVEDLERDDPVEVNDDFVDQVSRLSQLVEELSPVGGQGHVEDVGQGDPVEVENDLTDQMSPIMSCLRVPSKEVILCLANLWPECEAICVFWDHIVVELFLMSRQGHSDRLQGLYEDTKMGPPLFKFHNGPLPNSQRTRVKDIKTNPKRLLKSTDCKMGDLFIFDSPAVGRQVVVCYGRRFTIGRKEAQSSESHGVAAGDKYVAFEQSVFLSNSPESFKKLHDRGCHSVFLQHSRASLCNKGHRTPTMMMEEGGDVGFVLHLDDLQFPDNFRNYPYIMFADSPE
ncbi:hypothetical protein FPOAC2_12640 [Fusarium poae]|uniref:hypothetical protein n=1 Tax=Fusarium poae TaxID=36050 RepID=UPI001CE97A54|nr:hypothetical protein FPOAC1_012307 [Fusarium poae]KAG8667476.1 hypothetical protein FPOAC1_012307 [Fusarium poae]